MSKNNILVFTVSLTHGQCAGVIGLLTNINQADCAEITEDVTEARILIKAIQLLREKIRQRQTERREYRTNIMAFTLSLPVDYAYCLRILFFSLKNNPHISWDCDKETAAQIKEGTQRIDDVLCKKLQSLI